ncbi:MAG TPA: site-2 protease family protein, partial [Longimicrobium sp.]|nr:site-2 protease family protein [Longimicrobium sp.]
VVDNEMLPLGESALFMLLRTLSPVGDATFVALHPLAFAGWLGLFFTALNLFPVSQLDGGHVVFALTRRAHRAVGILTLALLLALSFGWIGWLVWAGLVMAIGRGRLHHPPVWDPGLRLDPVRRAVAWACIAIFLLTLVPIPFPT